MQNAIKAEIKRLSAKAFLKQARQVNLEKKYQKQFEKRTGVIAGLPIPRSSSLPRHFDAAYCARNANFLAKTIWYKVINCQYDPVPAVNYEIPKPDGGKRSIMAFSIPDAALANVILRRTRDRNLKRLSPFSYAYHPQKDVFDAILALREYESDGKLFAVQIDFEKYFDNIPSWYLKDSINDHKLTLTIHERFVFERFLRHRYAGFDTYKSGKFERRIHGTPQGSSVSLLLANIASHDLDNSLAAVSGRFVRFADDVVALCSDYSHAQQIEKCFAEHCSKSGIKTNVKKSPGIAIISLVDHELRTYRFFDYLGYRFTAKGLTVPDKTRNRTKTRVARLANIYLLQYLRYGYNPNRASALSPCFDWDLLGLLYEIRRSLYGGLTEREIHDFIHGGKKLKNMRGLMGFYCLIDDPAPLRELDGWMLSIIRRAMVKRNKVLYSTYARSCPTPSNAELAPGAWLDMAAWRGTELPEGRAPSFVRGWRAARKHYFTYGLENVEAPTYVSYADDQALLGY